MEHVIHRVVQFEIVGPYTLTVRFADGSEQRIDFRPVLEGEIFGPLQDLQIFNTVELDPTFGTLQWPTVRISIPKRSTTGRSIVRNSPGWLVGGLRLPIRQ